MWRTRELKPTFVEAIDTIEEFGCQVMHIRADSTCPSFSYTVGVTDVCGKPELITVGLMDKTAHHALNESVALMKRGINLSKGRHRDIVGDVEVEFRPVDAKWLHHIMLRTDWFYEAADVPVLQLIYPDLENRFEGEEGFDETFLQPDLSIAVREGDHGELAYDLWASHDPNSSLSRWKFPDPPHTGVYLSQTVFEKEEPVTYVSHDLDDGSWQFLGNKMSDGGGPVLSCFHHPVDYDSTLQELYDLPRGWYAIRDKPGDAWQRFEHPPETP